MDVQGLSADMGAKVVQNSAQEMQKQEKNQEDMAALETFKALLQKASQL